MNNSVISDEKYKEIIIRLFNNVTVEHQDVSPVLLLNISKSKLKNSQNRIAFLSLNQIRSKLKN